MPLRVLSYNVHELADDTAALARVLLAAAPDVVCLQEAPTRLLTASRLQDLAAATGLWVCAAGRAGAGAALLVSGRVDVRDAQVRALPVPLLRRGVPVRRRGWAEALVRVLGPQGWSQPVGVRSVHLGLDPAERLDHCWRLAAQDDTGSSLLATAGERVVVAGDLNEEPDGAAQRFLRSRLTDPLGEAPRPATFSARRPRRRIDAVLLGPGLAVADAGEVAAAEADLVVASDHRPVRVDLLVPAAG
ncbi:endonuclease/exonuclease/phosphatase family metal-dependent hydrolase [Kineococcus xinjiangensis]|uniref:Endonuclease/exonuclease/phosphatase family metal-dependent hydrolase n=1 Tax=Kineococcus xinjiangensis TaxID=512762 RepID=A0A2S6IM18_9ACTN|nr:endonuclease/exonuclease/phosphatase family metal-dependent hydrolase [Kineococcus xinjiangensis]